MKRLLTFLLFIHSLFAGVDPMELKAKVFSVYISKNPYCDSPVQAFQSTDAEYYDFMSNPTLGSLDNSRNYYDGTYYCLIFQMSERLYFRPMTNTIGCLLGAEYSSDICPDGTTVTAPDGSTSSCGSGDDTIYLYLSTAATSTTIGTGNPFSPPTASNLTNGIQITSPFYISGANVGKFVVNGTNKITSSGVGNCSISFPAFSFR